MKKVIALSAVLVMGALGMACGDAGTNNSAANANKAIANALTTANAAAANAANQIQTATNQIANAVNAVNTTTSNKPADDKMASNANKGNTNK